MPEVSLGHEVTGLSSDVAAAIASQPFDCGKHAVHAVHAVEAVLDGAVMRSRTSTADMLAVETTSSL